jgi:hypothetical protein
MRKSAVIFTVLVLLLTACCTFLLLGFSLKALDAAGGVVYYPYFRSTAAIDASSEMYADWGWKDIYEQGSDSDVTISTIDLNGKKVSINFKIKLIRSRATIVTEAGSEFTRSEIATELARRIGVPSESVRHNTMQALILMNMLGIALLLNGSRRTYLMDCR